MARIAGVVLPNKKRAEIGLTYIYGVGRTRSRSLCHRAGIDPNKKIADLADLYYIWTAAHNPASPLGTIASAHAASAMREFRVHELANWVPWWPDLVIKEGPFWENGYFTIQDKPGYGVELNPDVAKAHLAPGETWWG